MIGIQDFGSGPGGPMISGKWINKQNGNVINVRDCVINGDEMILLTDRGHISMDEFSRNYIQTSNDVYDKEGNIIGQEEIDPKSFITQDKNKTAYQSSNENNVVNNEQKTLKQPHIKSNNINDKESEKEKLIKTIFDKTPSPELTINIDWTAFPQNELNMLISYFDVSKNDIAKYISKSIDSTQIMSSILEFLNSKLQ